MAPKLFSRARDTQARGGEGVGEVWVACSGRQVNEADTFQQLPREKLQHSCPGEWRVGAKNPCGELAIQTKKLQISIANSGTPLQGFKQGSDKINSAIENADGWQVQRPVAGDQN